MQHWKRRAAQRPVGSQQEGTDILIREGVRFTAQIRKKVAEGKLHGDKLCLGIRPEDISVDDSSTLRGEVISAFPYGMETTVVIRFLGADIRSVVFGSVDFAAGQQVGITVKGNNICFFDPETEQLEAIGALTLQK